jgi:ABC-type glycerol-3-phosphate transport system substrate-binding protein
VTQSRMTRRKFLYASGAAATGLVAAACAPQSASPSAAPSAAVASGTPRAPATVDWWTVAGVPETGGSQEATTQMLNVFKQTAAGQWVTPKPNFLPDDGFSEKMTTVMGSGVGVPDVTSIIVANWFPGALDLRPLIARDNLDTKQYSKIHWDTRCLYQDKVIGLPTAVGATMYFYNTSLMDAKSIKYPEWGYTMNQFISDASKISDRSKRIFGATIQTRIWRGEMFAFGARPFSDDGKTVNGYMNGPKTVKALEFTYDLARSGAVPSAAEFEVLRTEGSGPIDLFNTGRLGFAPLNNGQYQIVDKSGVKFGLVHNPQVPGEPIITNGWAIQIGIPAASKNPEAAWEWLKWYAGEPGQRYLQNLNKGFTSVIPAMWKDHPAASDARFKFFQRILETDQVWAFAGRFPYFNKVTALNQDLYDRIYLDKVKRSDIQSELDKVVPAAQAIVDEERKKLGL